MRLFIILTVLLTSLAFSKGKEYKDEIVLSEDNTLVLNAAFSGDSVSKLIGEAKAIDANLKSGYPIYLFLDTPGGGVQAGLELVEYLKGLNRPVHTVTLFAASMGWQLLQHLGDRYVLRYGVLMSHKASGGFSGEFGGGGSQIDSRYGLWLRRLNMMDQQTVDRTKGKKTLKKYHSEYDNELWLNGPEAVEHGYADKVAVIKCDKTMTGTRDVNMTFFGMKITFQFDKCPIRTNPQAVIINVRTNKGYMELDEFLSKGGIFGKKCRREGLPPQKDWQGEKISNGVKAQLCAADPELSLPKIKNKTNELRNEITGKNGKIVKMNFYNFVTER